MFSHSPTQEIHASETFMFDRLFFEADLPKKELPEEIKDQDMSEVEFQTSDLNGSMDTWSVSTAGELFYHEVEQNITKDDDSERGFVVEESQTGIKKVEDTKSVHFYRVFEGEEQDYWVSFDALFHKGKLLLVELNDVSTVNRQERIQAKANAEKFMQEYKARNERKTSPFLKPVKLFIGLSLVLLHWVGRNISNLHSKL
tara:strand:- start:627 stop:1226 length:600 start_codon:yes stop_codon:yes gene_type:complete